ncbi:MAG: Stp1/IreP family PP2C-type Ser/Thr phosphatase [Polyangiaceae bacterium]|nr:Stp1/IreP family PP2C-type Ser/Thr phosphatase [Polyangiaceae bacterium]
MRAVAAGLTDVGRERKHNEDRFILLPQFGVFAVADGMGGHQSGEVASRMAAQSVAGYFRTSGSIRSVRDALLSALSDANSKIFARADDSRAHRGMGTTVVAAAFSSADAILYIAHAGDSRCYRVRDAQMEQLTRDHSLLQDALLERPDLTESDLAYLPRNVITRALGIGPSVELDVRAEPAKVGDCFLLCSDGLHGLVPDDEMVRIVLKSRTLTEACQALIRKANANGGKDNITAVLIRIEDEDAPWAPAAPSSSRE